MYSCSVLQLSAVLHLFSQDGNGLCHLLCLVVVKGYVVHPHQFSVHSLLSTTDTAHNSRVIWVLLELTGLFSCPGSLRWTGWKVMVRVQSPLVLQRCWPPVQTHTSSTLVSAWCREARCLWRLFPVLYEASRIEGWADLSHVLYDITLLHMWLCWLFWNENKNGVHK